MFERGKLFLTCWWATTITQARAKLLFHVWTGGVVPDPLMSNDYYSGSGLVVFPHLNWGKLFPTRRRATTITQAQPLLFFLVWTGGDCCSRPVNEQQLSLRLSVCCFSVFELGEIVIPDPSLRNDYHSGSGLVFFSVFELGEVASVSTWDVKRTRQSLAFKTFHIDLECEVWSALSQSLAFKTFHINLKREVRSVSLWCSRPSSPYWLETWGLLNQPFISLAQFTVQQLSSTSTKAANYGKFDNVRIEGRRSSSLADCNIDFFCLSLTCRRVSTVKWVTLIILLGNEYESLINVMKKQNADSFHMKEN